MHDIVISGQAQLAIFIAFTFAVIGFIAGYVFGVSDRRKAYRPKTQGGRNG